MAAHDRLERRDQAAGEGRQSVEPSGIFHLVDWQAVGHYHEGGRIEFHSRVLDS